MENLRDEDAAGQLQSKKMPMLPGEQCHCTLRMGDIQSHVAPNDLMSSETLSLHHQQRPSLGLLPSLLLAMLEHRLTFGTMMPKAGGYSIDEERSPDWADDSLEASRPSMLPAWLRESK